MSSSISSGAGGAERVKVVLRIRPLIAKEKLASCKPCVQLPAGLPHAVVLGSGKAARDFDFDSVLPPTTDQARVFDAAVAPLLDGLFDGINSSILAYGQTASGKSYTMGTLPGASAASDATRGIIPRVIDAIFARMADESVDGAQFLLRVSFIEIYNETIRDLLNPELHAAVGATFLDRMRAKAARKKTSLKVREDADGVVTVVGATDQIVTTPAELTAAIATGTLARSTGATDMNAASNRSHCIITLTLERHAPGADTYTVAKLNLVDLAGSERLKRTHASGKRLAESKAINKGLLALGNVISALASSASHPQPSARTQVHVPYRSSKLTRVLQDSLGGSSRTVMLACISPADVNYAESLNTLKYASRARAITNHIRKHAQQGSSHLCALSAEVEQLQLNLVKRALIRDHTGNKVTVGALLEDRAASLADLVKDEYYRNQIAAASSLIISSSMALRASVSRPPPSPPAPLSASDAVAPELLDRLAAADHEREQWLAFVSLLQERGLLDAELRAFLQDNVLVHVKPFAAPIPTPTLFTRPTTSAGPRRSASTSDLATSASAHRPLSAPSRPIGSDGGVLPAHVLDELEEAHAALADAQEDLARDEEIFAAKTAEIRQLHDLLAALQAENDALRSAAPGLTVPAARETTPAPSGDDRKLVAALGVSPAVGADVAPLASAPHPAHGSLMARMFAQRIEDANDNVLVIDDTLLDDDDSAIAPPPAAHASASADNVGLLHTRIAELEDMLHRRDHELAVVAAELAGGDTTGSRSMMLSGLDESELPLEAAVDDPVVLKLKAKNVKLTRRVKELSRELHAVGKDHATALASLDAALSKEKQTVASLTNKLETQARMLRIKSDQLHSARKKSRSPALDASTLSVASESTHDPLPAAPAVPTRKSVAPVDVPEVIVTDDELDAVVGQQRKLTKLEAALAEREADLERREQLLAQHASAQVKALRSSLNLRRSLDAVESKLEDAAEAEAAADNEAVALAYLGSQVDSLLLEKSQLEAALDDAAAGVTPEAVLVAELEDELDELDAKLAFVDESIAETQDEINASRASDAAGSATFLEATLSKLASLTSLDAATNLLKTYFLKIVELKEEVYVLDRVELPSLHLQLDEAHAQLAAAHDTLALARSDTAAKLDAAHKDTYYYKTTNKELKAKLRELMQAAVEQQALFEAEQEQYDALDAEARHLRAELDRLRAAQAAPPPATTVSPPVRAAPRASLRPLTADEISFRSNLTALSSSIGGAFGYEDDSLESSKMGSAAGKYFASTASFLDSTAHIESDADVPLGSPPR
ncbi:kinesin [Thecamonas trahens ATCC 50062]|uniref:Kinesin n=1 Tax=Thecamonas trahens ATCC 50062 TaxID=461836 RepID=A0A0L0DCY0_THETB|nr:kinesin [Thecamonas trahens ATCC 50062]KNC49971.1 kinesin [Thecamonas trahens ATCC 50062]|eukprot:XP_013757141.1 kinesin [Thecamonas trahens ATCC 50062]